MSTPWSGLIGEISKPRLLLVTTHCPRCDYEHRLEAPYSRGLRVNVLCHGCESVFVVHVPE